MALENAKLMAFRPADIPVAYTARDYVLYSIAIGIGMGPVDANPLRFVDARRIAAFPTRATTLGWLGRLTDPEFGIDERMVVLANRPGNAFHCSTAKRGEIAFTSGLARLRSNA